MIEIKPGPELDRAVAAVAFNMHFDRKRFGDCPKYSTDLNAAFVAAFAVGLFRDSGRYHLKPGKTRSLIIDESMLNERCDTVFCYSATPALAICAAILKLKENRNV